MTEKDDKLIFNVLEACIKRVDSLYDALCTLIEGHNRLIIFVDNLYKYCGLPSIIKEEKSISVNIDKFINDLENTLQEK